MAAMHNELHPTFRSDCYLCKLRSVSISAAATPTRKVRVNQIAAQDKQTKADCAAYRRLVKDGMDNFQVDGSARREAML